MNDKLKHSPYTFIVQADKTKYKYLKPYYVRLFNNTEFIEAKNRRELYKILGGKDNHPFAKIVKAEDGYWCFKYLTDYKIWRDQK